MRYAISEQQAYPWTQKEEDLFRGYFFFEDDIYKGKDAIEFLKREFSNLSGESVSRFMTKLDGIFSFVISEHEKLYFGGDRLRGLPLFYSFLDDDLVIGNDVKAIVKLKKNNELNRDAIEDLKDTCLFVFGRDTLIKDVFQVRAAEICCYYCQSGRLERQQYFHTEHKDFYDDNDIELIRTAFHQAYFNTGKNLVKALDGRTAVIPLSGGADSRMVVSMLKNQGYEKVICYTYGKPGNRESEMSKAVAEEYGYEWHIIPHSAEEIAKLRNDPETEQYSDYAFMYCTTPHFQDYYAVRELHRRGIIPEDSVFVPGHSGDIPNGNHVAALYLNDTVTKNECLKSMAKFAYTRHCSKHHNRILEEYPLPETGTAQDYASIEEWMDTAERQAKFIVHSTRVYEFFGYEWLIPLWDKTQFDFWEKISLQWRFGRKLYYYIVSDKLPSTNDVTAKKKFEKKLRTIPVVHQIASRTRRIQNWWISPLQLEHYFTASEYFKACLLEKSTFDVNTLLSKRIINELTKEDGINSSLGKENYGKE
jgi:asparagine synthase (glutamine-hydrolysing)